MDDLKKFSQNIANAVGSVDLNSAGIDGVGDVVNRFLAAGNADNVGRAAGGLGTVANQVASDEEAAAERARAARIKELEAQMDPGKYERVRKEDGGFAYFDPSGKEIDIDTYARRTGMRRIDAIKGSDNPLDWQFEEDFNRFETIARAQLSQDPTQAIGIEGNGFDPTATTTQAQLNKLMEKYPHMFGRGNYQVSRQNLGKPVYKVGGGGLPTAGSSGGAGGWRPS